MAVDRVLTDMATVDKVRNFGFLAKDVSRLSAKLFERRAREQALTLPMSQCKVLALLARHEGISQARLADLTETDPMTLVRTLDRMQQDGLIERRADPADRRAHRLYLLDEARPIVERIWEIAGETRSAALAALSQGEREQLVELLERVHRTMLALEPK